MVSMRTQARLTRWALGLMFLVFCGLSAAHVFTNLANVPTAELVGIALVAFAGSIGLVNEIRRFRRA